MFDTCIDQFQLQRRAICSGWQDRIFMVWNRSDGGKDLVGDEDLPARLAVMAIGVEAAKRFDSADDAVGGGLYAWGLLDEIAEGVLASFISALGKAERAGMAVDHKAAAEAEVVGDFAGAFPVEKGLLDGVAVGVVADAASGRVVAEAYVFVFTGPKSGSALSTRAIDFTSKVYYPLANWDRFWDRGFGIGILKIIGVFRCGAGGIVEHVVVHLHGVYLARWRAAYRAGRRGILFPFSGLDDWFWRDRGLRRFWLRRRDRAWIRHGCIGAEGPLWGAGQDTSGASRHQGCWRGRRTFAGGPGAAAFSLVGRPIIGNVSHKKGHASTEGERAEGDECPLWKSGF